MTTLFAVVVFSVAAEAAPDVAERMTKAKLEADLGNFEAASEAFALVAEDAGAPRTMRWEALVRLGLARYAAGDVPGSRKALRSVKQNYFGDAAAIRFLTYAVATSIPGKNWLDLNSEIEDLLRTGEVVSAQDVKEGGSGPKILFLERDQTKLKAIWRPAQTSAGDSFLAELGAYELDKILGLDMVPPTVERTIGGMRGEIELWVQGCRVYKEGQAEPPATEAWSRDLSRMKTFDYLIGNRGRNLQNILIDPQDEMVLVDYAWSFSGQIERVSLPPRFDRRMVEKVRALRRNKLQFHLRSILRAEDIESMLTRRDALLAHIEELVAEKGEKAVFF